MGIAYSMVQKFMQKFHLCNLGSLQFFSAMAIEYYGARTIIELSSRWWFHFFYFHPYLGKWSNLTNIFHMGWNHQPEYHHWKNNCQHLKFSMISHHQNPTSETIATQTRRICGSCFFCLFFLEGRGGGDHGWLITMVIVSPLRIVSLPNGLNGL